MSVTTYGVEQAHGDHAKITVYHPDCGVEHIASRGLFSNLKAFYSETSKERRLKRKQLQMERLLNRNPNKTRVENVFFSEKCAEHRSEVLAGGLLISFIMN
eukprot:8936357-Karenia_brevis.AAC.1